MAFFETTLKFRCCLDLANAAEKAAHDLDFDSTSTLVRVALIKFLRDKGYYGNNVVKSTEVK